MSFLFWLLWIIDLLLAILILWGKEHRSSYGASVDLNTLMLIGVVLVLFGSLVTRYYFKNMMASLMVVALPLIGMFVWYLFDRNQ